MRSPEPDDVRPIRKLLVRLIKAPAVLAILWPALLIGGGYMAWHRWGAVQVAQQYHSVDPTLIRVTEPPPYVRVDVVKAVYRDTAMEGLSLLDRQATAKIAAAFSMHPWVRNVTSVRKLPGGVVEVRLEYREPVAMVQVFRPDKRYFPVDGEGMLLPAEEFAPAETRDYIWIDVPGADSHSTPAGSAFGDSRVEAAARLAAVLAPYRKQAKIKTIGVYGDPRQSIVPQLELTTADQSRWFWGSPPGSEPPGEATAEMKLRKLLEPSGSGVGGMSNADLRMANVPGN